MRLNEVLDDLSFVSSHGDLECDVQGVAYDSRRVRPGDLFVALRGERTDGHRHIQQAFELGAVAALTEEPVEGPCWVQVQETLPALALAARKVYGSPADNLTLVGVTGSNGKTTTSYIIESILMSAGRSVGLLGTVEYRWGGVSRPAPHTTPFSSDLHEGLSEMSREGVDSAVMEVSSHALALHRVDTIQFQVAAFTNLSHEHLDFHGTMEGYAATKLTLFTEHLSPEGKAIVNNDDVWGRSYVPKIGRDRVTTYGFSSSADLYPESFDLTAQGIDAALWTPAGRMVLESNLLGRHNLYNLLAAVGSCLALGLSPAEIEEGVRGDIQVPGRLEAIDLGQPFRVLVDYAHTPDGLEQVLNTVTEIPRRKVICVVGAGGDRDKAKRPLMASIAQRASDLVVLTSDNPRCEDPESILDDMESGMVGEAGTQYLRVADRREAIRKAIQIAEPEDVVLIAGKGHEDYQEIDRARHPFDDREESRNALEGLGYGEGKA